MVGGLRVMREGAEGRVGGGPAPGLAAALTPAC